MLTFMILAQGLVQGLLKPAKCTSCTSVRGKVGDENQSNVPANGIP